MNQLSRKKYSGNQFKDRTVLVVGGTPATRARKKLGLGDMLRILPILPNLNTSRLVWSSDGEIFPLIEIFELFGELIEDENLAARIDDFDVCIDLSDQAPIPFGMFSVSLSEMLGKDELTKETTFDLADKIRKALGIDRDDVIPLTQQSSLEISSVGINYLVPEDSSIKALPTEIWEQTVALLECNFEVSLQPDETGMATYVNWLKSTDIFVSVVGLGCHIAMLLGKPLITLAGPTDFTEAHSYKFGEVLNPSSPCEFRPCQLQTGMDNCGCMGDFSPQLIANAVRNMAAVASAGRQG